MRKGRSPRPPRSTRPVKSRSRFNPMDFETDIDQIDNAPEETKAASQTFLTQYKQQMPGVAWGLDRTHQGSMRDAMKATKHNFRIVFVTNKWRPNQKQGEESYIIGTNRKLEPHPNAVTLAIDLSGRSYGDLHAGIQRSGSMVIDEWDALHAFGERQLKLFWAFFESYGKAIETHEDFQRRERKAIAMLDNYIWNVLNIQSLGIKASNNPLGISESQIVGIKEAYGLNADRLVGGLCTPGEGKKIPMYRSIDLGGLAYALSPLDAVAEQSHEGSDGQRNTFTVECLKYIFENMVVTKNPKDEADKTWYSGVADLFAAAELTGSLLRPMTHQQAVEMLTKAGRPDSTGDAISKLAEGIESELWPQMVELFDFEFTTFYNQLIPNLYGTIWAV